ncbi:MAG: hypothetical protein VB957_08315 [Pseudomonadales bacterium]
MKLVLSTLLLMYSGIALAAECVILLHGLARSASTMEKLEVKLIDNGYIVANIDYPSRHLEVEKLAELAVGAGISECAEANASPLNFVTHSLGGILVRQYYKIHEPESLHRVVMLGPPNNGSEVVDHFRNVPGYELLNGPAGLQLGTGPDSVPLKLGPVNFQLGVIAGTQSMNPILSLLLENPDDGKVSVKSTKVEGMCAHVSLPTMHPFMMKNEAAIDEVLSFLASGEFKSEQALAVECPEFLNE